MMEANESDLIRPEWDRAPHDPEMTTFKRAARLHQSTWRAQQGFDHGEFPPGNPNGSILAEDDSRSYANFLSEAIIESVRHRESPEQAQKSQSFDKVRLHNNLLSSMPMCFNLFGELFADPSRLSQVGEALWGIEDPGDRVEFEWSPSRLSSEFTGDRTAFDVALFFGHQATGQTIVGVETKYHEHSKAEARPNDKSRMPRYRQISKRAIRERDVFKPDWEDRIVGTPLQQIWRDHLLLLSMLQHPSNRYIAGRYVLVYPSGNHSFRNLAREYETALADGSTFEHTTVEAMLDAHVLHTPQTEERFRKRYLW